MKVISKILSMGLRDDTHGTCPHCGRPFVNYCVNPNCPSGSYANEKGR